MSNKRQLAAFATYLMNAPRSELRALTEAPADVFYRQAGAGTWIAYRGRQAIAEKQTRGEIIRWFREQGIAPRWCPLGIHKVS